MPGQPVDQQFKTELSSVSLFPVIVPDHRAAGLYVLLLANMRCC